MSVQYTEHAYQLPIRLRYINNFFSRCVYITRCFSFETTTVWVFTAAATCTVL